jgi:transcription elongation factor Elf1
MEQTTTRIFSCPMCGLDAPHSVAGELNEVIAIRCSNCGNGSLVRESDLDVYQLRWAEELREIIASLDPSNE